ARLTLLNRTVHPTAKHFHMVDLGSVDHDAPILRVKPVIGIVVDHARGQFVSLVLRELDLNLLSIRRVNPECVVLEQRNVIICCLSSDNFHSNALLSLQKPKNFALIKIDELSRIQVLDCQIFISFTKPAKDNLPRPDVLAFLVYESPSRLYLPQTLSSRGQTQAPAATAIEITSMNRNSITAPLLSLSNSPLHARQDPS